MRLPGGPSGKGPGASSKNHRHYKRLRERIAADSEAELENLRGSIWADESLKVNNLQNPRSAYNRSTADWTHTRSWSGQATFGGVRKDKRGRGAAGKLPIFGLFKRGGEVRVILPRCLADNPEDKNEES